uniref:NAD(+) ADP-ribosyltransferase n=1 Tax=uncultured Armatimonadetes bacterium TaxID=157466 RepID=A0A6J4II60_9BACT|nr:Poly [ADP-ribose] polymerase-1 [uncultured Armatimonadetes bacterium]
MLKAYNLSGGEDAPAFPEQFAVLRSAVLNRSDILANNNKFYVLELHEADGKFRLFTNYGRVGAAGVREARFADERDSLEREFERILREKTGPKKGYVPVDVARAVVGSDGLQQETEKAFTAHRGVRPSVLHPSVAAFVERIFDESRAELVRRIETPLGALSKEQIERGSDQLRQIRFAIARDHKGRIPALSSQYYSLVPHRFGRRIDPAEVAIDSVEKADEEEELLQLMRDVFHVQKDLDAEVDRKYRALGAELEVLDPLDPEAQRVVRQVRDAQSARHGFTVKVGPVFRARLPEERARFDLAPGNVRMLFHGSKNANLVGILSRGLLVAPKNVAVTGYMFGKGIYFADQSTKSAQYSDLWDGGGKRGAGYLFLADVALGRVKKEWFPKYREEAPGGFHSVQGCKGLTLLHNEFIVYRKEQCTIRYVAEIKAA